MPEIRGTVFNWVVCSKRNPDYYCPLYLWALIVYLHDLYEDTHQRKINKLYKKQQQM